MAQTIKTPLEMKENTRRLREKAAEKKQERPPELKIERGDDWKISHPTSKRGDCTRRTFDLNLSMSIEGNIDEPLSEYAMQALANLILTNDRFQNGEYTDATLLESMYRKSPGGLGIPVQIGVKFTDAYTDGTPHVIDPIGNIGNIGEPERSRFAREASRESLRELHKSITRKTRAMDKFTAEKRDLGKMMPVMKGKIVKDIQAADKPGALNLTFEDGSKFTVWRDENGGKTLYVDEDNTKKTANPVLEPPDVHVRLDLVVPYPSVASKEENGSPFTAAEVKLLEGYIGWLVKNYGTGVGSQGTFVPVEGGHGTVRWNVDWGRWEAEFIKMDGDFNG